MDVDTGTKVATSSWENGDSLFLYHLTDDYEWEGEWISEEENDFFCDGFEKPQGNKLSFPEWLEKVIGVSWNDFDNNYDGDAEYDEYNRYVFDGLPRFVQKSL